MVPALTHDVFALHRESFGMKSKAGARWGIQGRVFFNSVRTARQRSTMTFS